MKEICEITHRITSEKYKGGVIIDILWEVCQKSSEWLKEWISILLQECQQVFIRQIASWISHG